MNIRKSLLFLNGHRFEDAIAGEDYRQGFGNRIANERALRPRWHGRPGPAITARPAPGPGAGTAAPCLAGCG